MRAEVLMPLLSVCKLCFHLYQLPGKTAPFYRSTRPPATTARYNELGATLLFMLRTLTLLGAIFLAAPMWAQDDLPEAPGKATVVRICTGCHGVEMFSGLRMSSKDWDSTITSM